MCHVSYVLWCCNISSQPFPNAIPQRPGLLYDCLSQAIKSATNISMDILSVSLSAFSNVTELVGLLHEALQRGCVIRVALAKNSSQLAIHPDQLNADKRVTEIISIKQDL